jgi:hypothetical protein
MYIVCSIAGNRCPLDVTDMCNEAESFCQYDLLHNATYANSTTIDGVPVDLFAWDDYLVIEDMAQNALYMVHNAPVPVQRWQRLTPFGKYVGNITQSYGGFTAGLPTSDAWTKVIGADYCQQVRISCFIFVRLAEYLCIYLAACVLTGIQTVFLDSFSTLLFSLTQNSIIFRISRDRHLSARTRSVLAAIC